MSVAATISGIGEKAFIRDFIKPLFNRDDEIGGVGDDCAMVPVDGQTVLLSTDRVPADLVGFRLGILDHAGLGDYLARLNLSDIAACGGQAVGLLLNLGLPPDTPQEAVRALCRAVARRADTHGCKVLGGDLTSSAELSLSATSIGLVPAGRVLTRRGARPGDSVFLSRPLGLSPAAFQYFLTGRPPGFASEEIALLTAQFTSMAPMLPLGWRLSESGLCSACMDNTDGIGQSLTELAESSGVALIIEAAALAIPPVVQRVCEQAGKSPMELAFDGGADFSLVGTLRGCWSSKGASDLLGTPVEIVGYAESGGGVWLQEGARREPLRFRGWNYFLPAAT